MAILPPPPKTTLPPDSFFIPQINDDAYHCRIEPPGINLFFHRQNQFLFLYSYDDDWNRDSYQTLLEINLNSKLKIPSSFEYILSDDEELISNVVLKYVCK